MGQDTHHSDEEFDGYVVDTRRAARWTESSRHGAARRPQRGDDGRYDDQHSDQQGDGDGYAGGYDERPDRTRVMPAVQPPAARDGGVPPGRRGPLPQRPGRTTGASAPRTPAAPPRAYTDAPRRPVGSDRAPRPARRRRPRWGRLLALLLLLWLAFLVITPLHAWSGVHRADTTPPGDRPTVAGGHNYLLLGSDSRVGLTPQERARLGASAADGQRTDSIILVHSPGNGGKAALISIPRDSYVPIPGHGTHKINAAYSIGGPRLLQQTVEQVGGIRIDGVFSIGFAGFADVVDSVGGVTLCPKFDMKDPEAGIDLKKGCQTMNGPNALGYVRTRHTDPRGDIGRADRQREFLGAIMKKALSPATVLLPWRYWSFTHAAAGSVAMSDTLGPVDAYRILGAMRGTGSGDTLSLVVPIANMGYPTSDGSAVKWNTAEAQNLFQMIRDDTPMDSPPPGSNG